MPTPITSIYSMALSNTYLPLSERTLGSVGVPLPGVCVKVVNVEDEEGKADTNESEDVNAASEIGELRIKGPAVFSHYFNKPDATASAFDENGWFRTGDIVKKLGCKYYILGRSSTDIIKVGGFILVFSTGCYLALFGIVYVVALGVRIMYEIVP